MTQNIRHRAPAFRIVMALCAIAPLGGCSAFLASKAPGPIQQVSSSVQAQFVYNNDERPVWPPRRTISGQITGNCMTYSRLVSARLRELGLQPRYRNVLAPERIPEHVVTLVTDHAGRDWVLDNRFDSPYPASLLSKRYRFETGNRARHVGAMRKKWVSRKPRIRVADARIIR